MKKILFILHIPPPVHGAAMVGQYIKQSKSINTGFDCRYINLGTSRTLSEIGSGRWLKWKRYGSLLYQSFRTLMTFKPDLVYLTLTASGNGFFKDTLVALLAKAMGKKVVYHMHNKGVSRRQERWLDNILYKKVFRNAFVILLSEHLYTDIEKYVPQSRVRFCANGIPDILDENIMTGSIRKEDPIQLLFLSNLIESKGVFELLEACNELKKRNISFRCIFVGGEGDITAKEFENMVISMGLTGLVVYGGRKYDQEKLAVFAQSDIFVLPTFYPNECFPLVLLEAMQFSLPVVSTFEGGIPEIVVDGKTGFLIPQNDITALSEKLEILIDQPILRNEMGIQGKNRFDKKFTLKGFEERLCSILNDLALK